MVCRFSKVSEEESEERFFHPSDLLNTEQLSPLGSGKMLRVLVYIHHYSPPLQGIAVQSYKTE